MQAKNTLLNDANNKKQTDYKINKIIHMKSNKTTNDIYKGNILL